VSANVNLDALTAAGASFSTPVEVVDSLGATHVLTITFTKGTTANSWDYSVSIPGEDVASGTPGTPTPLSASGSLTFDETGKLTTPAVAAGVIPIDVTGLVNGAADMQVNWSLYGPDQTSLLTQYAAPSAVSSPERDGLTAGQLTGVAMADGGRIVAKYSNGEALVVAQLALASIRNPESLVSVGDNLLEAGPDSAEPALGVADSGGRGKVVGGALESSTVDIAREFTNLIVYQRSYQANARVITTADQLSQEVMNLKR
jgi:flagellar hook protein FlgE